MDPLFRGPHPNDEYLRLDSADLSLRCSGSRPDHEYLIMVTDLDQRCSGPRPDLGYLRSAVDLDQRCSGPHPDHGCLTSRMILHRG